LESAASNIASRLKSGDLIVCRSTVPVGTTRTRLIPILEAKSQLVAGKDFHVAFAPERTVEGNALQELKSLPQVIGGFTKECSDLTTKVFQKICSTIVNVESLEVAEIIKLVNNTFRDTVFGFANEIALLCDQFNTSAFDVISAANEGYPRNPIPLPSPGVGGMCLVKDPYLYSHSKSLIGMDHAPFGQASRVVNARMPAYVFKKYQKFLDLNFSRQKTTHNVLIIGVAFKGLPETSDARYSPGVELADFLKESGCKVFGFDAVMSHQDLMAIGIAPVSIEQGIRDCQAIFVMNNHPGNSKFDTYKMIGSAPKPLFFFDGWNAFNRRELESIPGTTYCTLGYVTRNHAKGT
jgi:UDP-N-acetyl-D-mannosaminuronic acid dehydrogenase